MNRSGTVTAVHIGDDVYGSDGDKVGTVASVQPTYLVVEKGFFFPTDYYIPFSAITRTGDGRVTLNVSRDTALHSGWETVPLPAASVADTDVVTEIVGGSPGWQAGAAGRAEGYVATSEDEIVIPVREEELTATVRETAAGAVRIEKHVIAEDRVLDVPVTDERVRVERRVVDRAVDATDTGAFEEIVIEVPLTAEQVELHKQARVAEEVVVHKDAVKHTEHVRGTVRHEEVDVVDESLLAEPLPAQDRAV
ncbi:MAG: PRC and DUF2382 domain-containing protein [Thermomicrobiales bacterium]